MLDIGAGGPLFLLLVGYFFFVSALKPLSSSILGNSTDDLMHIHLADFRSHSGAASVARFTKRTLA